MTQYANGLDEKALKTVNSLISQGERVEIIPFRDGTVKIIRIRRVEMGQK